MGPGVWWVQGSCGSRVGWVLGSGEARDLVGQGSGGARVWWVQRLLNPQNNTAGSKFRFHGNVFKFEVPPSPLGAVL